MTTAVSRRRFTVDEFHRMSEVGILGEDDRVELLEGQIVEMAAIGSRHAACVDRLTRLFSRKLHDAEAIVRVQGPVRIDRQTELVPDVALLRPRDDFYARAHPRPEDVLLIVEVAETTVEHDRQVKIPVYGKAGIPETWLVNLVDRRLEVFRDPDAETGYRESLELAEGQAVGSRILPDLGVEVDELLA